MPSDPRDEKAPGRQDPAPESAPAWRVGDRVRLKSFNGSAVAPPGCEAAENYWRLVGAAGTVVACRNESQRWVIQFDPPVASFGLHCHNETENSLFILGADLEALP